MKYLFIFIVLSLLSLLYYKLASYFNIIDNPNERSSHKVNTIRGGGILFLFAVLAFFFLNDFQYPYFTIGVLLISVVSFLDDIYTLSSKIRFPFQFLAIFLILYQTDLSFTPVYIFLPVLMLGIGMINMFNFMDGINGITGLYCLAVISGIYTININEQIVDADLMIYAVISIVIFGFYNFRKKALFFAGDVGSISIGMLIFFLGLFLTIKLNSPLIIILIVVYGADVGVTLLYRIFYTNENVFEPHRHHIYQKLVDVSKLSHLKVSVIYAILQFCVNFIVLKTYQLDMFTQLVVFFTLVFIFMGIYILLFYKLKGEKK